jgi:hypothetical protein
MTQSMVSAGKLFVMVTVFGGAIRTLIGAIYNDVPSLYVLWVAFVFALFFLMAEFFVKKMRQ